MGISRSLQTCSIHLLPTLPTEIIHFPQAAANAVLNGLQDTVHFRAADVFDELPRLAEAGETYDLVILDPPAFAKSRATIKNAMKGYREINIRGMKLVKDGGYLATCSCSYSC